MPASVPALNTKSIIGAEGLKCPGAPVKVGHSGFQVEYDSGLVTPEMSPRDKCEPKCPDAPLRKGHKGFHPEPNDGF